jgi:hypothetical protein
MTILPFTKNCLFKKVTAPARLLRYLAGKLMEIRPVDELKSIRSQFLYQCEFANTKVALEVSFVRIRIVWKLNILFLKFWLL